MPVGDPDSLGIDARSFLEIVGGSRCPCGHSRDEHQPPDDHAGPDGMGPCESCECQGLIAPAGEF